MIRDQIHGAAVLDLFAGTGSLSFESLSRGAESVVAVEISRKSLGILQKNAQQFEVGSELVVRQSDVEKFLNKYEGTPFDIIFVDPPFTEKLADPVMKTLSESAVFSEETEIFIESTKHEPLQKNYGPLTLLNQKSFGDKFLSVFGTDR